MDSSDAVIVVVPTANAVTVPLETMATDFCELVQTTTFVRSFFVPSLYIPVALTEPFVPSAIVKNVGDSSIFVSSTDDPPPHPESTRVATSKNNTTSAIGLVYRNFI